ncbi:MAG: hypothetical protein M3N31_07230 [Actinomycetota bacterium]|nr:hypothetical protein [Actinomycetota bacterium]
MERRVWGWLGPVSGILFAVLLVAALATGPGDPGVDPDDPAGEIAGRLVEQSDDNRVSFVLFGLALFFFIWFLGHMRDRFHRVGEEGRWLVSVFWAGGLLVGAAFLVLGLVQAAQFAVDDYGADVQAAKALFALGWNAAAVLGPPVAAMAGAAAVVILRFGVLPTWLGWVAVVSFVAAIVAPWIPVFVLWVLLVSVALLVEHRRPAPAAGAPSG